MPVYTPVDHVAKRLNVTAEQLWVLQGFGWISIVEKNGTPLIRGDQEYRAKFILRLQQIRGLTPQEISGVLAEDRPTPLRMSINVIAAGDRRDVAVRCLHEGADSKSVEEQQLGNGVLAPLISCSDRQTAGREQ
jgi:hypothetical protein